MNNLNISISTNLVLIFILITFTSCLEDPLTEEENLLLESQSLSGPNPLPEPNRSIDETQLQTIHIEWYPTVSGARKAEIRNLYADADGEFYLHTYSRCLLNSSIESWEVIYRPENPPKDRTPDPLIILEDHEDEMKNESPLQFSCF